MYKLACALSGDSNPSAHPHRRIRVLVFCMKKKRWSVAIQRVPIEDCTDVAYRRLRRCDLSDT